MSDHSLPTTLDPFKYADQNKVLEGRIAISLMSRLTGMLVDSSGVVGIELEFAKDAQNLRILKGKLSTDVNLLCQRCLNPVSKHIQSEFTLGIVMDDEQAQNLPKAYEPIFVEHDSKLVIQDVIEEEIILTLPMFAYHEDCQASEYPQEEDVADFVEEEKVNPFDVLAGLKLKK